MIKTKEPIVETQPLTFPLVLRLPPAVTMSEDEFFEFCQQNDTLWIERTAQGDIEIMPPAGGATSARNSHLTAELTGWAKQDGSGVAFDATGGFTLPNSAVRSPDVAWVRRERLAALTQAQKERFLPLCPDFVVELRSRSDSLSVLQAKLEEYIANGARLGWLIDPLQRRVYVYRPGAPVETLDHPASVSAEPELPGFSLDLATVWEPGF